MKQYTETVNYIMDQLAVNRGAGKGEKWKQWLERINQHTEIDTSMAANAARTLFDSVVRWKKILVWGDFDADGITSTAILYESLRHWCNQTAFGEERIQWHIPHRIDEGHGIDPDVLFRRFFEHNEQNQDPFRPDVLVVVDTGIEEREGVERFLAEADNMMRSVVIVDHHATTESRRVPLNWLDAHMFTHDLPEDNPNKPLCGAGLAGLLHMELDKLGTKHFGNKNNLETPYDLMALGTIADMVPMMGINRHIVRTGLIEMRKGKRKGLASLLNQTVNSNNLHKGLATDDIAFGVAPKINASSRLGAADKAFLLMGMTDNNLIRDTVNELTDYNKQRKKLTEKTWREADLVFRNTPGWQRANCCVVIGEDWHPGILGIVANKFLDKYKVPAFCLTRKPNSHEIKGSARSVDGINLVELLELCSGLFRDYGGHKAAAGVTLKQGVGMDDLIQSFSHHINVMQQKNPVVHDVWNPDLVIPLSMLSIDLLNAQKELEPTGMDNPHPVYETKNLYARAVKEIPGGHVKFQVANQDGEIKHNAIWFNPELGWDLNGPFDLLYELRQDNYRKQDAMQLVVRGLRK